MASRLFGSNAVLVDPDKRVLTKIRWANLGVFGGSAFCDSWELEKLRCDVDV